MTVGFWNFVLCFVWPWHTLTPVERLSIASDRLVCDRCGRQYAINHDVMAVLPWSEVESFYRDRKRMSLWRNRAFDTAAEIADRYGEPYIANDIRALKKPPESGHTTEAT